MGASSFCSHFGSSIIRWASSLTKVAAVDLAMLRVARERQEREQWQRERRDHMAGLAFFLNLMEAMIPWLRGLLGIRSTGQQQPFPPWGGGGAGGGGAGGGGGGGGGGGPGTGHGPYGPGGGGPGGGGPGGGGPGCGGGGVVDPDGPPLPRKKRRRSVSTDSDRFADLGV